VRNETSLMVVPVNMRTALLPVYVDLMLGFQDCKGRCLDRWKIDDGQTRKYLDM
jgi:hypothetical protein